MGLEIWVLRLMSLALGCFIGDDAEAVYLFVIETAPEPHSVFIAQAGCFDAALADDCPTLLFQFRHRLYFSRLP